jgi:hypothetical protein
LARRGLKTGVPPDGASDTARETARAVFVGLDENTAQDDCLRRRQAEASGKNDKLTVGRQGTLLEDIARHRPPSCQPRIALINVTATKALSVRRDPR